MMDVPVLTYNSCISDIRNFTAALPKFERIVKTTDDPEQKARYEEAIKTVNEKILPLAERQAKDAAKRAGIPDSMYGQLIPISDFDKYDGQAKGSSMYDFYAQLLNVKV